MNSLEEIIIIHPPTSSHNIIVKSHSNSQGAKTNYNKTKNKYEENGENREKQVVKM